MKPMTSELSLHKRFTLALTDYFRSLEGDLREIYMPGFP